MVPADSDRASPTPPYSGYRYSNHSYAYGTVTLYGSIFQKILLQMIVHVRPYNPCSKLEQVWAFPCSLATTYGITICFLFLQLLRCFSSLGCLPAHTGFCIFNAEGFPIRKSTDQSLFATPRSLSQLTTSFVVSESQGIHHAPLFASDSLVDSRIKKQSTKSPSDAHFLNYNQPFKELLRFGSANIVSRQLTIMHFQKFCKIFWIRTKLFS